jgi:hypothetical protein
MNIIRIRYNGRTQEYMQVLQSFSLLIQEDPLTRRYALIVHSIFWPF